jgi:hypothetical protein
VSGGWDAVVACSDGKFATHLLPLKIANTSPGILTTALVKALR